MVTFYLMTQKGYLILNDVINSFGASIIDAVVSERDSNIEKDFYDEIESLCAANDIKFCNRKDQFTATSKYCITISWRWLIKEHNSTLIVIHDSLLPRYRGFNPLVTALINGDDQIGATALFANEEFDTGDIIYQSAIDVQYPLKIADAIRQIVFCYTEVIKKILQDLLHNQELPRTKQDDEAASYSLWRDEKDYEIDWNMPAPYIKRYIDSLGSPYKGASTSVNGMPVRIIDAAVADDLNISNRTAGKIIFIKDGMPHVVCGAGILKIQKMLDDNALPVTLNKMRVRFG